MIATISVFKKPEFNLPYNVLKRYNFFMSVVVITMISLTLFSETQNSEWVSQHWELPRLHSLVGPAVSETLNPTTTNAVSAISAIAKASVPTAAQTVLKIQHGDTLSKIFARLALPPNQLEQIMQLGKTVQPLKHLHMGDKLYIVHHQERHQVEKIFYPINYDQNLLIQHIGQNFTAKIINNLLEPRIHYSSAEIHHSLFKTAQQMGLPESTIYQLAQIFAWDIDFTHDLQPGDRFTVMYEDYYAGDNRVKKGHILAAVVTTQDQTFRAIRYTTPDNVTDYYTPEGRPLHKAFLRAPVKYDHIASTFSNARYHPILHRMRAHQGVDFAAPMGTPIFATGNGHINFMGRKGGYGNVVIIDHSQSYASLYGHMMHFAKNLHRGSPVHQGQIIGYVGKTGLATGPHVHYEFHINGRHYDPLKVKLPHAGFIAKQFFEKFKAAAASYISQLDLYEKALLATKE